MKSFLLMLTFLTRIPVKTSFGFKEKDFIKGIYYMPVVGLVIGLILWAVGSALGNYLHPPVLSVLLWILYIYLTGGLHIDGLADTVDGIYSNRDRERVLEIMRDSHIGTFGVLAIGIVYLVNVTISMYLPPISFLIIPVVGRSAALIGCFKGEYARKTSGMGKALIENIHGKEALYGGLFSVVLGVFITKKLSVALAIFLTFAWIYGISQSIVKKLGGFTGDTIGFTMEISQSIFIVLFYFLRGMIG